MKAKTVAAILTGALLAALIGLNVRQIADAASCTIDWDTTAITCYDDTKNDDTFSFILPTSYYSQSKGQWTLLLKARDSVTDGLDDGTPDTSPTSRVVDDGGGTTSGVIQSSCWGTLDATEASPGVYQLNAWDSTGWACSGGHDVTVKPYGVDC